MGLSQNDLEHLKDLMDRGLMSADQANIEMVRMARVRLVQARVPAETRKSLNAAVKSGKLCHKKKDGRKPEVYYHPSFEHLANAERHRVERETLEALAGVLCKASDI